MNTQSTINKSYELPNGTQALYVGAEETRDFGRCFCFLSETLSPDWSMINYIPVKGAVLRNRKIHSERGVVCTVSRYMPQIPQIRLEELMRQSLQRLGATTGAVA